MSNALDYKLIKKAVSGDAEVINYSPYINTLASMTLYDSNGNEYTGVNVDLKNHLTQKLIHLNTYI